MTRFYYNAVDSLHITVPSNYSGERDGFLARLINVGSGSLDVRDGVIVYYRKLPVNVCRYGLQFNVSQNPSLVDLLGENAVEASVSVQVPKNELAGIRIIADTALDILLDIFGLAEIDFGTLKIDVNNELEVLDAYRKRKESK